MHRIETIADLLDYLGGQSETARWLGITQQSAREWIGRGQVPGRHRIKIAARLLAEGADFAPEVLSMTPEELAILRAVPSKKSKFLSSVAA